MNEVQQQFNNSDPAPPARRRRRCRRRRAAAVRLIDRLIDATLATPAASAAHMPLGENHRVQVMQGFAEEVEVWIIDHANDPLS
jgi:hypothetical protein